MIWGSGLKALGFRAWYKHLRFMAGFRVWGIGSRCLSLEFRAFVKDSCNCGF